MPSSKPDDILHTDVAHVLDHMNQGVLVVDHDMRIRLWNDRFLEFADVNPDLVSDGAHIKPLIKDSASKLFYTRVADSHDPSQQFQKRIRMLESAQEHVFEQTGRDGRIIEVRAAPLPEGGLIHTYTDVTTTRAIERHLTDVIEGARVGAWEWDLANQRVHANDIWAEMIGETRESLSFLTIMGWMRRIHQDDVNGVHDVFTPILAGKTNYFSVEFRMRHVDGSWVWLLCRGRVTERDANGVPSRMAGIHIDITEKKDLEANLQMEHERMKEAKREAEHLASRDPLTDLPNRKALYDYVELCLEKSSDGAESEFRGIAVVFFDLDDFKIINDSIGHLAGDDLLKQVAKRLDDETRSDDMLARLGGDEFILVAPDVSAQAVESIAQRMLRRLETPFMVNGEALYISASIGISMAPDHGSKASDLVRAADVAMYSGKSTRGKKRINFYSQDQQDILDERRRITQALQRGINNGAFHVVMQPKFRIANDPPTCIGYEALLRWNDADFNDVSPGEFVPIAEADGHIMDIDRIVIHEVCALLHDWQENGVPISPISINISARSLQNEDFADEVSQALAYYDIPRDMIIIEITETALLERSFATTLNLESLVKEGVAICVDDFGTGYASFVYLQDLPISQVKIDQEFTRRMHDDSRGEEIIRTIIQMAHVLEMDVVAEGVETDDQLEWFRDNGCQVAQGFHLSHPIPSNDVAALQQKRHASSGSHERRDI